MCECGVLVRCALLCGVCLRLCCVFVLKCSVRVCLEVDVRERVYVQVGPLTQGRAPGPFSDSLLASGEAQRCYSTGLRLAQGRGCARVRQRMFSCPTLYPCKFGF